MENGKNRQDEQDLQDDKNSFLTAGDVVVAFVFPGINANIICNPVNPVHPV